MTPFDAQHFSADHTATTAALAGADTSAASFDFPRLAGILDRMSTPDVHNDPLPVERGPHGEFDIPELLDGSVVPQSAWEAMSNMLAVEPIVQTSSIPSAAATLVRAEDPAMVDPEHDEIEQMIEKMLVRDVAREALRARLIAFGEGRQHRTAYETVFLMLAFAVMVLLAAPPLVDILLAANGVRPG